MSQYSFSRTYTIKKRGDIHLAPYEPGSALDAFFSMGPVRMISETEQAGLKERGSSVQSVAAKWKSLMETPASEKYIVCNADEGDPGVYKDRVLLKENPRLVLDGLLITGLTAGASAGILFIRHEYEYLFADLMAAVEDMRADGLLGENKGPGKHYSFDIILRRSEGAYIKGSESALTAAAEGRRADSDDDHLFSAAAGYGGSPAAVHTLETLSAAAAIALRGGSSLSSAAIGGACGTRIFEISGDAEQAGIYELPAGLSIHETARLSEAAGCAAVLAGGPSGVIITSDSFSRRLSIDDCSAGGSLHFIKDIFAVPELLKAGMDFFSVESCGWCVPCRAGTALIAKKIQKIISGKSTSSDLKELAEWSQIVRKSSRCGLGQTSVNAILSSLDNCTGAWESCTAGDTDFVSDFDLDAALEQARSLKAENNLK